jgi:hypothetical protein
MVFTMGAINDANCGTMMDANCAITSGVKAARAADAEPEGGGGCVSERGGELFDSLIASKVRWIRQTNVEKDSGVEASRLAGRTKHSKMSSKTDKQHSTDTKEEDGGSD